MRSKVFIGVPLIIYFEIMTAGRPDFGPASMKIDSLRTLISSEWLLGSCLNI